MTNPTRSFFTLDSYRKKIEDGSLASRPLRNGGYNDIILPEEIKNSPDELKFSQENPNLVRRVGKLDEFDVSMFSSLEGRCSPTLMFYNVGRVTGNPEDKTPVGFCHSNIGTVEGSASVEIYGSTVDDIRGESMVRSIFNSEVNRIGENAKIGDRHYFGLHECKTGTITDDAKVQLIEGGYTGVISGNAHVGEITNPSIEYIEKAQRCIEENERYRSREDWQDLFSKWERIIDEGIQEMIVGLIADRAKIDYVGEHVKIDKVSGTDIAIAVDRRQS